LQRIPGRSTADLLVEQVHVQVQVHVHVHIECVRACPCPFACEACAAHAAGAVCTFDTSNGPTLVSCSSHAAHAAASAKRWVTLWPYGYPPGKCKHGKEPTVSLTPYDHSMLERTVHRYARACPSVTIHGQEARAFITTKSAHAAPACPTSPHAASACPTSPHAAPVCPNNRPTTTSALGRRRVHGDLSLARRDLPLHWLVWRLPHFPR